EQQLAAAAKADSDARAALAALRAQGAAGATTLRAASAAIVTAVAARTHAIVAEGAPLLELAQRSGLVLVAGVVPAQASAITAGDRAEVTPIGATGTVVARVMLRGAAVDPGNGLVPVEVALPAGALLPGESAQAAITTGVVNGYVVPHSAVLVTDNGATYIVQDVHGTARTVAVRVLLSAGETDAVDGPLDGSAPLILAGAYQLHDGMKVRLADAAAQGR
ncbi:MAG: efflux RND transporter periplasmic adaptor subunit, partial [Candidatus Dormibacteria bacterium]